MGVYLTLLDENDKIIYFGTKLYGYVDEIERARGLRYLWDLNPDGLRGDFRDIDEFFEVFECVNYHPKFCRVSREELREFLKLYDEDLKAWGRGDGISDSVAVPDDVKRVWIEWG